MGTNKASLNTDLNAVINWGSDENHLLLNPRWSAGELSSLQEVAETVTKQFALCGHFWISTSGSTSESASANKLVALSKEAFLASARSVNAHLAVGSKDVWLQALPRFHVGGLGVEVRAELSRARVIVDLERWDPLRVSSLLEREQITLVSLVPTQVFDLVQRGLKAPASVRAVIVGGGALTESLYTAGRALGWPLLPSYGMTETCSQIATAGIETLSSTKMPRPRKLSHAEWRKSSEGLLEVRGESLLTCYAQRQLDGAIRGWDPKVDGWFQSEDLIEFFGEEIEFHGRRSDVIKIGGENSSLGKLQGILSKVLASIGKDLAAGEMFADIQQSVLLVDAPSERLEKEIHLVFAGEIPVQILAEIRKQYDHEVLPFERVREIKSLRGPIPRSDLGKVLWAQLKKELYGN